MTTTEILNMIQEEVGDLKETSTERARYLRLLNRAHSTLVAGGGELNLLHNGRSHGAPRIFPWALGANPEVITLEAPTTGTGSYTTATTTADIALDSATKDFTGYFIRFTSHTTLYRITAHSGTSATLDSVLLADTDSASDAFTLYKLDYDVTALLPVGHFHIYGDDGVAEVNVTTLEEFNIQRGKNSITTGTPLNAVILKQTGNVFTFRFDSVPAETTRAEIRTIPVPTDLDEVSSNPLLPSHFHQVLVHLTAFYEMRRNGDNRAGSHFQSARTIFDAMCVEGNHVLHHNDKRFGTVNPIGTHRKKSTRKINE